MLNMYDSLGQLTGSMESGSNGESIFRDSLGQVQQTLVSHGAGQMLINAMGTPQKFFNTVGNSTFITSATGEALGMRLNSGGRILEYSAAGMLTGSYDPMTGNVSNALGLITGSIR